MILVSLVLSLLSSIIFMIRNKQIANLLIHNITIIKICHNKTAQIKKIHKLNIRKPIKPIGYTLRIVKSINKKSKALSTKFKSNLLNGHQSNIKLISP